MNTDDFLGPYQPEDPKAQNLVLNQCFCDNCKNSFFVNGTSREFMPSHCCYCGSSFEPGIWEVEEEEDFDQENFLWM